MNYIKVEYDIVSQNYVYKRFPLAFVVLKNSRPIGRIPLRLLFYSPFAFVVASSTAFGFLLIFIVSYILLSHVRFSCEIGSALVWYLRLSFLCAFFHFTRCNSRGIIVNLCVRALIQNIDFLRCSDMCWMYPNCSPVRVFAVSQLKTYIYISGAMSPILHDNVNIVFVKSQYFFNIVIVPLCVLSADYI